MTANRAGGTRLQRARARLRYSWRLGTSDGLAVVRDAVDGHLRRSLHAMALSASDGRLGLCFAGTGEAVKAYVPYLEQRVERHCERSVVRESSIVRRAGLAEALRSTGAGITLVADTGRHVARLPPERSLILPYRLHQVVRITGGFEEMFERLHKTDRWRFNRYRRRHELTWEHATGLADLDFFLERMHGPTMRERFGARAVTEDPITARECLFRRGYLFFLRSGGERIAGALCRWDGRNGTLRYRLNGVLDGADAYRRDGAFTAIYYFLIEWAAENGAKAVDLSGSVPFLARGIFQSKRRLHAHVELARTPARNQRVRLQVARDTPMVRQFLVDNPVIACGRDGGLEAVYFYDGDRPPRDDVMWRSPGITGRRTVDLDAFLGGGHV